MPCSISDPELATSGCPPPGPGILVFIAVEEDTHDDGGEPGKKSLEHLVPTGKIEGAGVVKDGDNGVGTASEVMLYNLLHQPGALGGGGPPLIPKKARRSVGGRPTAPGLFSQTV